MTGVQTCALPIFPKWGGDRWEVKVPGEDKNEDPVLFMVLNDHEVIAKITGNPLNVKAFV